MENSKGTVFFRSKPRVISFAAAAGRKESEGPLKDDFDLIFRDSYAGKPTFEQAESELMRSAIDLALSKASLLAEDIGVMFCGDLLNQCIASSFAVKGKPAPYAGIYGACSTMALGMILSAVAVESGAAERALCAASSHYCTAERQYRTPLEYGAQRPPTAQWTVTGAGACVIGADSCDDDLAAKANGDDKGRSDAIEGQYSAWELPYIHSAQIGIINDMGVTDQNNMGAAMAPAAADTIYRYLCAVGAGVDDYDAVFTGDLGRVGSRLLYDLLLEKGVDLAHRHNDCGVMIFDEKQDVHAGGSGCGCCASVLCGHILRRMRERRLSNILFVATGALLSPTTVMQKQTIPSIAHLVNIRI